MARGFIRHLTTVVIAGYAIEALPALAQSRDVEPRLSIRVGASSTDNLGRQTDAVESERETFLTTGIDIGVERESARARAYIDGIVDYYAYDSDDYDNETSGSLEAGLSLRIVPERFSWEFNDVLDHSRLDPFAPVGPANRERLNTFSTGPTASVPLGDRSTLNLAGQYSNRRYEESTELEGDTRAANFNVLRELNEIQRLGFTFSGRDIDFDDPVSSPYDIHDAYLTYELEGAAADRSFSVSAGNSRVRRDGESTTEPYFELALVRDFAARSSVTLDAGQRIEGPGESLGAGGLDGYEGGGAGDSLLVADPRVRRDASVTYALTRSRGVFSLRYERFKERYETDGLPNRDGSVSSVSLDYRLTSILRGRINFRRGNETTELAGRADERYARASLARQFGRSWDASLAFEYNQREQEADAGYTERRYTLSFAWVPVRE